MKVLIVHNTYQQPGGEDVVVERERHLLEERGHRVVMYQRSNREIERLSSLQRLTLVKSTIWAADAREDLARLIEQEKPHVVHVHNTFVRISPSIYSACQEARVPVVQTLHNPRLLCPAATLYRNGRVCEDCLGKAFAWPGILHGCYQDSRFRTGVVAAMLGVHRWLKTWQEQVDFFIASTEFYRQKFIQGGLPAGKIVVKPHFVGSDPGLKRNPKDYALFMGRLSPEKGVRTLLSAWQKLKNIPLKIRGEGPMLEELQAHINRNGSGVELVPRAGLEQWATLMNEARFLVWPSEGYYETFGLVAIEAFAFGMPVIASRTGVMVETVEDGRTGLHFTAGDADDLAQKVEWAWNHPEPMAEMGKEARREYEAKYTAEKNYARLMEIYDRAISGCKRAAA
jgi:glycosyltransferase involved in cell wall biosynthesis